MGKQLNIQKRLGRKPFQGVSNIVRFNWHFFVVATILVAAIFLLGDGLFPEGYAKALAFLLAAVVLIPLFVSWYIYDYSDLYKLNWLEEEKGEKLNSIWNIHAGFDETSMILKKKFPHAELMVFDFYDSTKHTEISIRRARRSQPIYEGTIPISINNPKLPDRDPDCILLIFAAHEIRNRQERAEFFALLRKRMKANCKLYILEHFRDLPNLLAYSFGAFHFYSRTEWEATASLAKLEIIRKQSVNPFVHLLILRPLESAS
ncbi:MAG: methyltransferase [Chitinophagaceae bacterium]